jgi:GAF domain-containing protein
MLLEVLQLQSFAIIPLTVGQREIGGILVGRDEPSTYEEKLLGNLRTLASQAAITIENLRLLDETQQRAQELESLNEVGQVIASILDPQALIREIADITKARFGHDYVGIFTTVDHQLIFEGGSTIGESTTRLERGCMQFDIRRPGIPTDAARTGEPVLVNDVRQDPRYTTVPELSETRSKLVVPIEIKGRVIGVLDVERDEPFAYAQTDVVLLQSLANQAGVAIENARLFQNAERAAWREQLARQIMGKVQAATDVENILQVAVRELGQALRTPRAVVQLRSDNHENE